MCMCMYLHVYMCFVYVIMYAYLYVDVHMDVDVYTCVQVQHNLRHFYPSGAIHIFENRNTVFHWFRAHSVGLAGW